MGKISTGWKGIYYHFPEEWAENHFPGTGPESCHNCAYFGCINKIVLLSGEYVENAFVGYCANCAIFSYHGMRGQGMFKKITLLHSEEYN